MDIKQIKGVGKELNAFLSKFDDCFSRSGSRRNLRTYVKGQLSDLPRKSIEPIALAPNMPLRTLQCFRLYPYPLSRQKTGVFKVDSSPTVTAVGTEGARRATGVPTATPYTLAGVR